VRAVSGVALVFVLLSGISAWSQPGERRWAAIDPNGEASSPVAWGGSEEQARQRAIEACKRVSKTCANGPASTDDMKDVFAVMCCREPKLGCAVSPAASRPDASQAVQKTLAGAGFSNCSLRYYLSAATGRKQ
jgi:hypothetical protein